MPLLNQDAQWKERTKSLDILIIHLTCLFSNFILFFSLDPSHLKKTDMRSLLWIYIDRVHNLLHGTVPINMRIWCKNERLTSISHITIPNYQNGDIRLRNLIKGDIKFTYCLQPNYDPTIFSIVIHSLHMTKVSINPINVTVGVVYRNAKWIYNLGANKRHLLRSIHQCSIQLWVCCTPVSEEHVPGKATPEGSKYGN